MNFSQPELHAKPSGSLSHLSQVALSVFATFCNLMLPVAHADEQKPFEKAPRFFLRTSLDSRAAPSAPEKKFLRQIDPEFASHAMEWLQPGRSLRLDLTDDRE